MPAAKSSITVLDTVAAVAPLTGGAGPTFTGFVSINTQYGGIFYITITNSPALRSALPVVIQAEIAPTQTAGDEVPFDCRRVAKQEIGAVSKFAIRIPTEVAFARLKISHADVDVEALVKFGRLDSV